MYSNAVSGPADPNCTPTRRHYKHGDKLVATPFEGCNTLYDAFQRGLKISPHAPCMGYRPVVDEKGNVGPFRWFSYTEISTRVTNFASGLINLNLVPEAADGLKMIAHFSKNRMEWNISEHACNSQGLIVVPMYDTLGPETVEYILNQTGISTILISSEEFKKVLPVKAKAPSLKNVIIMDGCTDERREEAKKAGLNLLDFKEVEASGEAKPVPAHPPKPTDLATFCYTSGTTGDPKGAMLTHGQMIGCVAGAFISGITTNANDVHLSYLPLAHMFERAIQLAIFMVGGAVGYYQGNTLKLMEDLAAIRPTVFPSVPRLFNKIYDKVTQGIEREGGAKKLMFDNGFDAKKYWLSRGYKDHTFWDPVFFSKVRAKLGMDRVRLMITGSAPIADHVMAFLRCVFCCEVCEGYGQTETAAAATLTFPGDYTTGHVGGPLACCEIKLEAVPDMGYLATDTLHGKDESAGKAGIPCLGRGEVCFRGHNVFTGYFKQEAKTKEAIDSDGWLHSGDIAIWLPNGTLKLVDRKKNIFKLAQGEYIAAEKIEIVYQSCPFIAQPFVYGDSLQSVLVAILTVNADYCKPWAKDNGFPSDMEALVKNEEFKKIVLADIVRVAKAAKLNSIEIVKDIHLEANQWTADNCLTPTFKLKRNDAKKMYQKEIDAMYAKVGGITGKAEPEKPAAK